MSTTSSMPTYNDIMTALHSGHSPMHPSQVHGYLCGLICATGGATNAAWQQQIFGDSPDATSVDTLQNLYETSYHQMTDFSFEFSLLLPEGDAKIDVRTEALGLWSQGFLTGLQQENVPIENREPSDLTEAIDDLVEIAQVNFDSMNEADNNDDNETAYFELVEYVRLAALLVFHELRTDTPEESSDDESNDDDDDIVLH